MSEQLIKIRKSPAKPDGLRWWSAAGWSWYCPCCDTGGRASSWSVVGPRTTRPSPFARVICSVNRHLRDRHRDQHFAYVIRKEAVSGT